MTNLGKNSTLLGLVLALLLCPLTLFAQQQRVEVQLSTNRITVDESVLLSVRAYGLDKEIDYSSLTTDFDVTSRSSSRQITIENGRQTSLVEWVLELLPKRAGALEVPPVTVGSEQSRPLSLLVEPLPTGTNRDLYLESSVDDESPYVQAQVVYTLRIFQDVQWFKPLLQEPQVDGIVFQQITDEKRYVEVVDGRSYEVSEIRYTVFPQSSGPIIIPPVTLQVQVPVDPNPSPNTRIRTKRLTLRSNQIELDVQARPAGLAGGWWLPAKDVFLLSEWSEPIDSLMVDQPVTRTVRLIANGVSDSQLPELSAPAVENVGVYADSPTATTNISTEGLSAEQTNAWAVIPQVAGELTFPEIRVNWFDITTGEARVATLPAETLVVSNASTAAGQSGQSNDNSPTADSDALAEQLTEQSSSNLNQTNDTGQAATENDAAAMGNVVGALNSAGLQQSISQWRNAAIAIFAGWMLSLIALWFWWRKRLALGIDSTTDAAQQNESSRSRFQRRAGANASLEPLRTACEGGDAATISKAVLSWGGMVWPENAPTNTIDVAKRLESPELNKVFEALDAELYRPSGSVNPLAFDTIPALVKSAVDDYQSQKNHQSTKAALPSL